jgi:uncharacterized phiE125 gp8 family phage protein
MRRYRSLKRIAGPGIEPVELQDAKLHCRVDGESEDELFQVYIMTAREWVEEYIDRAVVAQQLVMKLDAFPAEIELPRPPMIASGTATAVTITYVTGDAGGTATLAASQYRVDRDSTPGVIRPLYGGSWPSHLLDQNSVTVTWWAGYTFDDRAQIPQRVRSAILMCVHELYEKRGDGAMPDAAKRLLDTVSWGSYT